MSPWGCPSSGPPPELEEEELSYRVTDALRSENKGTFEDRFQYIVRLALKAEVRRTYVDS